MSRESRVPGAPVQPATRVATSGWRDPRLWIGIVLLTASVVGGARLLASADDTVEVWALGAAEGGGTAVSSDDLVVRRVRFADDAELDRYFRADQPLPHDVVLRHSLGAGDLLPRSAVGPSDEIGLLRVPIQVEPGNLPPSVAAGSVVDVYLDDGSKGGPRGGPGKVLERVTVIDAPQDEESLALTGTRQVVVTAEEADAGRFEEALGRLEDPVVRIHQVS